MRLDGHVHVVGSGAGGTGCWMKIQGLTRFLLPWMLRQVGLPAEALRGDFDRLYVERLLAMVRGSSLDAAVLLAQEIPYSEKGEPMPEKGAFYVPNDYVLRLAREHREFLPAVSIHPARSDALEELDRCIAAGAVMMKCLPNCQNIDCRDRRFIPFWEKMAAAGLPLLAHTGGEHTLPVLRPEFADPRTLELPLECGVTVIAAHAASKSGILDPEYFGFLVEMMARHPRLYADNSAFNIPVRSRRIRDTLREPVASRIVHGSDFPVLILGHWAWMRGIITLNQMRRCHAIDNMLERDVQLKIAMGYSAETFTRLSDLLPLSTRRG